MSERAEQIVKGLLEAEHDEHVKAHKLVQHWDKAHQTYLKMAAQKREAEALFRELGQSIALHRALAHNGLKREQVARYIMGGQVGATDNYKRETPVMVCKNVWCNSKGRPQPEGQTTCPECQDPLEKIMRRTPPNELRGKFAKHIVGVETNDGRKVWFEEPIPPKYHQY